MSGLLQDAASVAAMPAAGSAVADVLVFLIAAVLAALGVQRLKWSPVVGYLIAGAIIGPHGMGLVSEGAQIHLLAEFGIVFLMFTIGLELSPARLRSMRGHVFGLGGLQVALTALAITLIARALGFGPDSAVVIGLALALSSTAVVMRLLMERDALARPVGQRAFGILLFQDIAVVPILLIVSSLGQAETMTHLIDLNALGKAALAVLLVVLAGRYLARPLFRVVGSAKSPELFAATTLFLVLASAWLMEMVGLSLAMGGFLAGVLLAETEYRTQVELDIEPFRGLLLGLFFITVGMVIDAEVIVSALHWIVLAILVMIAVKAAIIAGLSRIMGLAYPKPLRLGLLLGQAGEFGFVVLTAALAQGLIEAEVVQVLNVIIGVSIALTPALTVLAEWLDTRLSGRDLGAGEDLETTAGRLEGHVVITGFGRVGRTVSRLLQETRIPFIALDLDPARVAEAHRRGIPAFYGNSASGAVLRAAGLERAAMLVITLDQPAAAIRAVQAALKVNPDLPIVARAHDRKHALELERLGAAAAVPETLEASLQLGGQALRGMGFSHGSCDDIIERLRLRDYAAISTTPADDEAA